MTEDRLTELQRGFNTAFINSAINSNLAYRPQFIYNDNRNVVRTNDSKYMAHWAKKEAWYNKHFQGKLLLTYEGNDLTSSYID